MFQTDLLSIIRSLNAVHTAIGIFHASSRPRLRWMDSIKENMGFGLEKLKETVKDRNKLRRLVEEKTRNRERTNIKR